ncbi:MAG TPA: hypothetical protein VFV78_01220 [Vicinamibacterales bacterium]|nr:hypothetical protein [Vicinamibacterales bacterium]
MKHLAALLFLTGSLAAASPAPAQPAPPRRPAPGLSFTGAWDSAPHNLSTARNFESLFTLYGAGMDSLFKAVDLRDGTRGKVARFAQAPLDVYVAWLATLGSHEFGHCQQAWLAGSEDCHWIRAPGPYALGHIITVGDAGRLGAAGRMTITTGGVQATIAAADALKRDIFEARDAGWTAAPLLALRQLDFSLYGLTAPSPAAAQPSDYANDMTNYAISYGVRSGQGGEVVHDDIVSGAVWNLVDPMTWLMAYSYVSDYVIDGDSTLRRIGLRTGSVSWTATTNAWLSEVGVRYALGIFARDARGHVIEVTPSWGESQPAVNARWSQPLTDQVRAFVSGDLWSQREGAAPGDRSTGGAIGGGAAYHSGAFVYTGSLGYKSHGVMLGQPLNAGWIFQISASIRASRR